MPDQMPSLRPAQNMPVAILRRDVRWLSRSAAERAIECGIAADHDVACIRADAAPDDRARRAGERCGGRCRAVVLQVEALKKHYAVSGGLVRPPAHQLLR